MSAMFRLSVVLVAALLAPPALAQGAAPSPAAKPYIIYVSPAARRVVDKDGVDMKTRANRWRDAIAARGGAYTIATHPSQLAPLPAGAVIVLPSALVLEDAERALLSQRLAAGDSLLATGMPGALDAKGAPASYEFLEKTFNVTAKLTARGEKGFLVPVGDTPLTYGLAPGTRVWIGNEKLPLPLLSQPGAGYLSDYGRAAAPDSGLMAMATVGSSRRVLLGWTESAWDGQPVEFGKLANAALDWVEGRPSAYVRTWPWPYRGAMTIGIDSLWRFENLPRVSARLSEYGAHGSFHFPASEIEPIAAAIRDLPKAGHGVGGFGDTPQPLGGRPPREQRARVERMVDDFHRVLGQDFVVGGLRAPQGVTDAATEKAAASLDYLVDVGRVESLTPVQSQEGRLVLLGASANLGASNTADEINPALDDAMQKALIGGYAFVGLDLAGLQADSPMDAALTRTLDTLRGRDALWLGSATEVATWWRERAQLKVASTWQPGDSVMTLEVSLAEPLHFPAAIALQPPQGALPILEGGVAGAQLQERGGAYAIVLTGLAAGTHRLRVTLRP
jgi:hypothetical protein